MAKAQEAIEALKKYGGKYEAFSCDVTDLKSVRRVVKEVYDSFGNIDTLVNNSGVTAVGELLDMDEELSTWYQVLNVDLNGLVHMTYEVGKRMRDSGRGGSMINITSSAASIVHRSQAMSAYTSSKAAVTHFTHCMAVELGKYNIRVNALAPGFTHSDLSKHIPPGEVEKIVAQTPLSRFGEPIEVAAIAVYFASPASAQVTGADLVIDGGHKWG
jgi:3-oxoacyl-[acyl-carrier protein] reductase